MTEEEKEITQPIKFKFCFDKIEGKGQDAEPTLKTSSQDKFLLAVYDGMGSASVEYEYEQEKKASAYWASLFTKEVTEIIFSENINTVAFVKKLEEQLKTYLKEKIKKLEKIPPKFKGNLANRRLPTTIAGFLCDLKENKLVTFWAGDSRCFVLNSNGLVQFSKDDVVTNSDALENLINDAPLSNFVNADVDFTIHQHTQEIEKPCLLITATDGCFGYLESPAHFEYQILKHLVDAFNLDGWKAELSNELRKIAADDISLSLLALGYDENDFDKLKSDFQNRFQSLTNNFILPLEKYNEKILSNEQSIILAKSEIDKFKEAKNELRKSLWEKYKQNYELKNA
jgi:serine/threonine protein phosphatase PrpC